MASDTTPDENLLVIIVNPFCNKIGTHNQCTRTRQKREYLSVRSPDLAGKTATEHLHIHGSSNKLHQSSFVSVIYMQSFSTETLHGQRVSQQVGGHFPVTEVNITASCTHPTSNSSYSKISIQISVLASPAI